MLATKRPSSSPNLANERPETVLLGSNIQTLEVCVRVCVPLCQSKLQREGRPEATGWLTNWSLPQEQGQVWRTCYDCRAPRSSLLTLVAIKQLKFIAALAHSEKKNKKK